MILFLFVAGGAAISSGGLNSLSSSFRSPSSHALPLPLDVDYRGDDPGVYQYRDVAIGDVDLANPGLEIVRAGNRSSPTWGNVSVSKFNESTGFQNLTGIEHFWQEYYRVEVGQLRPGGPEEIVAVGRWSGDGGTTYKATVRIINGTAPASQIAWKQYNTPGDSYFWAVDLADVDSDGEVEFVAVGEVIIAPGEERGLVVVGNLTGGAIQDEFYGLFNGSAVPNSVLRYWSVDVADVDGQGGPEIVIAGDLRGAGFLQIANFSKGTWNQLENTTFRTYASSTVYMCQVADLDGNSQQDIVAVGKERDLANATNYSRVSIFRWDGGPAQILMGATRLWTGANDDASAYDVVLEDLTSNPGHEITTVGYNKNSSLPSEKKGELNVMDVTLTEITQMQWNGSDIDHWGLDSGDVDGDGKIELVSVGLRGDSGIWEGQTQVAEVPEAGALVLATGVAVFAPLLLARRSAGHQRGRAGLGQRRGF